MKHDYLNPQRSNTPQEKNSFIQLKTSDPSAILIAKKKPEGIKLISKKEKKILKEKQYKSAIHARSILEKEINKITETPFKIPGEGPIRIGDLPRIMENAYKTAPIQEADEFTPKAPTECIIQMASALRSVPENANQEQKEFIKKQGRLLSKKWMAHDFTIENTKNHLSTLAEESEKLDLKEIGLLARDLQTRLINPEKFKPREQPSNPDSSPQAKKDENSVYPLLHSNLYGRVFESEFINELMKNPPQEVKTAMQTMGEGVYDLIEDTRKLSKFLEKTMNGNYKSSFPKHLIKVVKNSIKETPTTWRNKLPELEHFLRKGNEESLKAILCRDIKSGEQSILTPYLSVKIFEKLTVEIKEMNNMIKYINDPEKKESVQKQFDQFSWMTDANDNYEVKIKNYKGKYKDNRSKNNRENEASGAGISLTHQPIAIEDKDLIQGQRPATVTMPVKQTPTPTNAPWSTAYLS